MRQHFIICKHGKDCKWLLGDRESQHIVGPQLHTTQATFAIFHPSNFGMRRGSDRCKVRPLTGDVLWGLAVVADLVPGEGPPLPDWTSWASGQAQLAAGASRARDRKATQGANATNANMSAFCPLKCGFMWHTTACVRTNQFSRSSHRQEMKQWTANGYVRQGTLLESGKVLGD